MVDWIDKKSSLSNFLQAVKDSCVSVRNGSYDVYRGARNWAEYKFTKYDRAIQIHMDHVGLIAPNGMSSGAFSLEMCGRMPSIDQDVPGIDDDMLEEMFDDAREILLEVRKKKVDGMPVAFSINTESVEITEFHSADLKFMGIIVSFDATF